MQGAVFRFEQIDGSYMTTGVTGFDGTISFEGDELPYGSYRVTEQTPPDGYVKSTRVETVEWDGTKDVLITWENVRDISLTIIKVDEQTGVSLPNATFDVYADGKLITSVTTNDNGEARVTGIRKEAYIEIVETAAPAGYVLDKTPHGIHIDPYDPATEDDPVLTVTNRARPALRILKYDLTSNSPMPDVTFEVWHDGDLFGEYTTNASGEIFLYDLEPGTYLVKEIATDDAHVVNSTPQQIELKAGDTQTRELVFFNSLKPGIHLIKVDSITMKSLPNVRFEFKLVGGSYRQEFTTDINGEIDLSKLTPGAYEVRELEAPEGYLIDDAVRVVQINPDQNANFVFTNTPNTGVTILHTHKGGRLTCTEKAVCAVCGQEYGDEPTGQHNFIDGVCTICGAAENDWIFDETTGVLTIGTDKGMTAWQGSISDKTKIKQVEIKNGVSGIGQYMFSDCSSLVSITIPGSVESIGNYAFHNCSNLVSINIPNSVKTIGGSAFGYCTNLKSITIPGSVESIGASAFYNCSNLVSINIPNSVKTIGGSAFGYCTNLKSITIPGSVESIKDKMFHGCSTLETAIYSGEASVEDNAFPADTVQLAYVPDGGSGITVTIISNGNKETVAIPDIITIDGKEKIVTKICKGADVTGVTVLHNHKGGTATCTEKAVCAVCGQEYGDAPKGRHNFIRGVCAECGAALEVMLPDNLDLTYDGTAREPAVTVTIDGHSLGAENYEISYVENGQHHRGGLLRKRHGGHQRHNADAAGQGGYVQHRGPDRNHHRDNLLQKLCQCGRDHQCQPCQQAACEYRGRDRAERHL